ncbi:unnamed protein product [Linum tenue]|uniref:Uncharacterized protein n=1 Tax=Linum tenue TaxID=586396 RepID=A0AAV0KRM3_9ROSI|nr:unnamed protein product [Linum tenue]
MRKRCKSRRERKPKHFHSRGRIGLQCNAMVTESTGGVILNGHVHQGNE